MVYRLLICEMEKKQVTHLLYNKVKILTNEHS